MFNPFKNKKAISGLIAIILLVVVCVALIVIILSWGKGFTNDSLDGDIVDTYKRSTELSGIIKSKQVIGNNVFLENISTNKNLEIVGYKINSTSTHDLLNTYVPLDENITLNYSSTQKFELPLPSDQKVMVDLYTSNNEIISVEFNNIQAITTFAKTFGGDGEDSEEGEAIQQTSDGGYIITGSTKSYGAGNFDVWLLKTDSSGNLDWNSTFGGTSTDAGYSVQQTTDGGYIVTGYTESYGAGNKDVYLIKTDSSGDLDWNKTFGGSGIEYGRSVQQTSDGGYIITGYTASYGAGGLDAYLIKTNNSGDLDWNYTFGDSSNDYGYSVQQTSDGGYIIGGATYSYGAGGSDFWLFKTDSSGNLDWNQTFGGSDNDVGYSVQQTTDSGYIVTGKTYSYGVGIDIYLVKTDSFGNLDWNKTFGGSNEDLSYSVQQTSDGGYIIGGSIDYPYDIYLIKTDSSGNMDWNKTIVGHSNGSEKVYSIIQTTDGGYAMTGWTSSYGPYEEDYQLFIFKTDSEGNCTEIDNLTIVGPVIEI